MIALGIAIVLGLIAVLLANTYLTGKERQISAGQAEAGMVRIAVASLPLAYGNEVTPDKVRFVPYPAASLPPGAFRTMAELLPDGKRRVALRPIQVNQPLLASDLTGEGQGASIAALLPDGMRAATVRINDVSGVAGFVKPNDTVDVLITRSPIGGNGSGPQVTDVLLQNIRVIAMGTQTVGADGQPSPTNSTTLEVTPLDAQKLVLGQQLGQLSLALRKPGAEQNIPNVETVSLDDLRYSYYGSQPPGGAAKPTPAAARVVRINRPRPSPVVRRPIVVVPSTSRVNVTRGTESRDYEVGGYAQ
jgi:pilus assembly protein CpaB